MDQEIEIWKPVVGYEGLYEVSNLGRVKSLKGNHKERRDMILKPILDKYGYLVVGLSLNKIRKRFLVHRLMALVFLGEPPTPEQNQVNHKTENPADNFICINPDGSVNKEKSTLEWCSVGYNNSYNDGQKRRGLKTSKPVAKIFNGDIVYIYSGIREAARQTGYKRVCIWACCTGNQKTAYGFEWKFL